MDELPSASLFEVGTKRSAPDGNDYIVTSLSSTSSRGGRKRVKKSTVWMLEGQTPPLNSSKLPTNDAPIITMHNGVPLVLNNQMYSGYEAVYHNPNGIGLEHSALGRSPRRGPQNGRLSFHAFYKNQTLGHFATDVEAAYCVAMKLKRASDAVPSPPPQPHPQHAAAPARPSANAMVLVDDPDHDKQSYESDGDQAQEPSAPAHETQGPSELAWVTMATQLLPNKRLRPEVIAMQSKRAAHKNDEFIDFDGFVKLLGVPDERIKQFQDELGL